MSDLDPAGLEAAAKALQADRGAPTTHAGRYDSHRATVAVRAYLAALPVPSDAETVNSIAQQLVGIGVPVGLAKIAAAAGFDAGFAAGRAAAHPAGHIYDGSCPDDTQPDARDPNCPACAAAHPDPPDEPFSDAAVDKIAWALMGDTLRMIDGLPPGARPAYRQGVRDRVRAALDVALPAAAVSPDQRLREAATDT